MINWYFQNEGNIVGHCEQKLYGGACFWLFPLKSLHKVQNFANVCVLKAFVTKFRNFVQLHQLDESNITYLNMNFKLNFCCYCLCRLIMAENNFKNWNNFLLNGRYIKVALKGISVAQWNLKRVIPILGTPNVVVSFYKCFLHPFTVFFYMTSISKLRLIFTCHLSQISYFLYIRLKWTNKTMHKNAHE